MDTTIAITLTTRWKRHLLPLRKRFPGIPQNIAILSSFLHVDHRQNRKQASYFEIKLPRKYLIVVINTFLYYIWNVHSNAEFFHEVNMIFLSFWLIFGARIFRLASIMFDRWKNEVCSKFLRWSPRSSTPPRSWIYVKEKQCGRRKTSKWRQMVFTSVYNVDDKLGNRMKTISLKPMLILWSMIVLRILTSATIEICLYRFERQLLAWLLWLLGNSINQQVLVR